MATVHCPISGITFKTDYSPIVTEYPHPIFTLPRKKLLGLYSKHVAGHLTPVDSYLLYLAYINSTKLITWNSPLKADPNATATQSAIANSLRQLITVIEQTAAIQVPSFKQPKFVVNPYTVLANIQGWIEAWEDNIAAFKDGYRQQAVNEKLSAIEEKLTALIFSGNDKLSAIKLADWADLSACFPADKKDSYKHIIRCCYDEEKMFGTRQKDIQEVRDFCCENILPGSIFHYQLLKTLDNGMELNKNYLGFGSFLLLDGDSKEKDELARIQVLAPVEKPKAEDYPDSISFLKAKLRYTAAGGKF